MIMMEAINNNMESERTNSHCGLGVVGQRVQGHPD